MLFLRPVGRDTGKVSTCTVWHFEPQSAGSSFGVDMKDIDLAPASYRAEFCVPTDQSNQRLLEKDARLVALAAQVLVDQFSKAHQLSRSFYVPTIVTTATLYTLRCPSAPLPDRARLTATRKTATIQVFTRRTFPCPSGCRHAITRLLFVSH